jgi:cytochrome P450
VGAPLARLEMLIAFETLFARLPNLRLAKPPQYKDVYHFHGLEELMVLPRPLKGRGIDKS